jgi:hypothetical protein
MKKTLIIYSLNKGTATLDSFKDFSGPKEEVEQKLLKEIRDCSDKGYLVKVE